MTVSTTNVRHVLTATGSNRDWEFTFRAINAASLRLWEETDPGIWVEVPSEEYTVVVNSSGVGGTVTYPIAPVPVLVAGKRVTLTRETNRQQLTELNNTTTYRPEVLMAMLDKLTLVTQDLAFELDRAVRVAPGQNALAVSELAAGELLKYEGGKIVPAGVVADFGGLAETAVASATAANQSRVDAEQARDDTELLRDEVEVLVTTIVGDAGRFCAAVVAGGGTYYSLTPSVPVTALTDGLRLSFIPPSMLIAPSPQVRLPGLGGNIPVFNNTGEIVPPDYIRVGYRTELTYDEFSGGFLTPRPVVRGETVNGTFIQFEDGTMICEHSFTGQPTTTAAGALFTTATSTTWTFPKPFLTGTFPSCHADVNASGRWANVWGVDITKCDIREFNSVSNGSTFAVRVSAIGRWY